MTRTEKQQAIKVLRRKFKKNSFFYLTDSSKLSVAEINDLRARCFHQGVELKVVKNTLAIKAMQALAKDRGYDKLHDALKGPTAIMFSENASAPARIIKEFRKDHERPILKAAYIDSDVFYGDDQVDILTSLKTKEEILGEIIGMLESPIQGVLSAIDGGSTIAALLTTLEERTGA